MASAPACTPRPSEANELGPLLCAQQPTPRAANHRARGAFWLGGILVVLACAVLSERKLWRPHDVFGSRENVQIAEAQAWWNGRLDLPERVHDTAFKDGRAYSYFPPMFTFVAAMLTPFFGGVPHLTIVALVTTSILLFYWLSFQLSGSAPWSVLLTLGFICGTSAWPVFDIALRSAPPYHVNHLLSTIGILLLLTQYFGRRRVWVALLGLAVTALSRQLTVVFALPLAFMAYADSGQPRRWSRLTLAAAGCVAIGGVYLTLNTLKFGSPLTTGYMLNHEGRDDVFAREARAHGTLSAHWIPRNLYYANVGLPELQTVNLGGEEQRFIRPNSMGTGIWWTSPVLLWLFVDAKRIVLDSRRRCLLISAALLFALLMLWHATGALQRGYNRYSLDYVPVLFALVVPACLAGWRRWMTCAMIAWGMVYYVWVLPIPHIRLA